MKSALQKADDLREEIRKFRPFAKETLGAWQEKLRIDWTYNSNAIEGNTLTYGETAFFLREGLTSEGRPLKDYVEAKNHAEAIDWLHEMIRGKRPFTEGFIKELHALLLRDIHFTYARGAGGKIVKKPLTPGQYKTRPNHVLTISGRIHYYVDPLHVKDEMEKLMKWYREAKLHPVEKAALFHYHFVAIHPFDDGNGRMARLLMNLILMKSGWPPCIIKNTHRRQYLDALERADGKFFDQFVEFIASELVATQQLMLDVLAGRESAITAEALPKSHFNKDQRLKLILAVIGGIGGAEPISISQILKQLPHIKRPTLKADLAYLLRAKKIKRRGIGKGTLYSQK